MPGALGLGQPGIPGPGSTEGCPRSIRVGALVENSRSGKVSLFRSPTCISAGLIAHDQDVHIKVGVQPEVWRASVLHADSGPVIRAQGRCPSLGLAHGGPHPAEPWTGQQTYLPGCLRPVLQTSEALLSLVLGTELRVVQKSCAERCPKSGTQPRGLSVM